MGIPFCDTKHQVISMSPSGASSWVIHFRFESAEKGKIVMEYSEAMRERGMKVLRHELKHGDKRKLGDVVLELEMASNSDTGNK